MASIAIVAKMNVMLDLFGKIVFERFFMEF